MAADHTSAVLEFIKYTGISDELPAQYSAPVSYSNLVTTSLRSDQIKRSRVTCTLTVEPCILVMLSPHHFEFGSCLAMLHSGVVAAVSERVSIDCARTVVGEDREMFLGKLGISYPSSASQNAKVTVDGSIVRSGRNVTTVAVDINLGVHHTGYFLQDPDGEIMVRKVSYVRFR